MIDQYYRLASSYAQKDFLMVSTLLITLFVLGGWWLVRKINVRFAEQIYIAQILILYIFLLIVTGKTH